MDITPAILNVRYTTTISQEWRPSTDKAADELGDFLTNAFGVAQNAKRYG
jgi:hypothetical protein